MHAWEQIQKTVDYLDEHLAEEVNMEALAEQASLSLFYFQRLFCRLVNKPVAEYIKLRRMTKAADMLLAETDKNVMDIALECGFTSHESFSRAFKTAFGLTPTEYRKEKPAINRMIKPNLLLKYVLIDEGVPLITDGMVLEINRKVLDAPVLFTGLKRDVPLSVMQELGAGTGIDPLDELWNNIHDTKKELGVSNDKEELGVTFASAKPDCFCYFAGSICDANSTAVGPDTYTLLEGEYVVCTFEPDCFKTLVMDSLYKAQQYLYNIWLPKHSITTDPFEAERYKSHTPETTSMEIWLRIAQ